MVDSNKFRIRNNFSINLIKKFCKSLTDFYSMRSVFGQDLILSCRLSDETFVFRIRIYLDNGQVDNSSAHKLRIQSLNFKHFDKLNFLIVCGSQTADGIQVQPSFHSNLSKVNHLNGQLASIFDSTSCNKFHSVFMKTI